MSKKITLTAEELSAYGIGNNGDLLRLQARMSEIAGEPVELAPLEGISPDVQRYLESKGLTAPTGDNIQPEQPKSLINSEDIQQFINSKKQQQ